MWLTDVAKQRASSEGNSIQTGRSFKSPVRLQYRFLSFMDGASLADVPRGLVPLRGTSDPRSRLRGNDEKGTLGSFNPQFDDTPGVPLPERLGILAQPLEQEIVQRTVGLHRPQSAVELTPQFTSLADPDAQALVQRQRGFHDGQ